MNEATAVRILDKSHYTIPGKQETNDMSLPHVQLTALRVSRLQNREEPRQDLWFPEPRKQRGSPTSQGASTHKEDPHWTESWEERCQCPWRLTQALQWVANQHYMARKETTMRVRNSDIHNLHRTEPAPKPSHSHLTGVLTKEVLRQEILNPTHSLTTSKENMKARTKEQTISQQFNHATKRSSEVCLGMPKKKKKLGSGVHPSNPSTWETRTGGSWLQGQLKLDSEILGEKGGKIHIGWKLNQTGVPL